MTCWFRGRPGGGAPIKGERCHKLQGAVEPHGKFLGKFLNDYLKSDMFNGSDMMFTLRASLLEFVWSQGVVHIGTRWLNDSLYGTENNCG